MPSVTPQRSIRYLISAKLGRCAACMRQTLRGAVASLVAFIVAGLLWPGSPVTLAALAALIACTALWLLHVVALSLRSMHERNRPDTNGRLVSPEGEPVGHVPVTRKQVLGSSVVLALLLALPGQAAAVRAEPRLHAARFCGGGKGNCYCNHHEDCRSQSQFYVYCQHFVCLADWNYSGYCWTYEKVWGEAPVTKVVKAFDRYFRAYLQPIEGKGGHPPTRLLKDALAVDLPGRLHFTLQTAVHSALYETLGMDFDGSALGPYTSKCYSFGNIRGIADKPAAVELVSAARRGMVGAMRDGDLTRIKKEIGGFWKAHPDYRPLHYAGPCYPPGVAPEDNDPRACQTKALTNIVGAIRASRT